MCLFLKWTFNIWFWLIVLLFPAEGAENGLEFTIVRPFNWIGPRMDFIPGIDGPSEGVPRVLACFSNVCVVKFVSSSYMCQFVMYCCFNQAHCFVAESPTPRTTQTCGWWPVSENFYLHQRCNWSCSVDDCELKIVLFLELISSIWK